jgi:chromosome partitioning protein
MHKIALINQKGGVGKTTSTINLGAGLKQLGFKVLLIDMDPQANLSYSLGIQAHALDCTVYDVLKGEVDYTAALQTVEGVDVLPSTLDLAGFDLEYSSKMGRENRLKRALKDLAGYDYILVDCPPSLGL